MEQELKQEAERLLMEDKVDYIVGFEKGSRKFTTRPLITGDRSDIGRLTVNAFMTGNLAKYLTELKGRVGIVARGCDSRSVVSLIQDNKVSRENLVILGLPCPGVIDLSKIGELVARETEELKEIVSKDDSVIVTAGDESKELPLSEVLFDSCLTCEFPTPAEYDILLGPPRSPRLNADARNNLEEFGALPPEKRWQFWKQEFSRCIRCYACRSACPMCYCQECFVEETEPKWIAVIPGWEENFLYQITRTIHLAGRCTDCGACERACPVNIPLRRMTRKMYDLVSELYQYKAGTNQDLKPLMAHYADTDSEDFIK